jgi:hypothetical protein
MQVRWIVTEAGDEEAVRIPLGRTIFDQFNRGEHLPSLCYRRRPAYFGQPYDQLELARTVPVGAKSGFQRNLNPGPIILAPGLRRNAVVDLNAIQRYIQMRLVRDSRDG